MHIDQLYADAIEMEYRASKTGYDNVENTLPRVLAGRGDSKNIHLTRNPLPGFKLHGEWDCGDGATELRDNIMAGVHKQKNIIQNDISKLYEED